MKKSLSWLSIVGAVAVVSALLVGGCARSAPSAAEGFIVDPIKVEGGYIAGTVIGEPGKEVRIYRGIPYAAPPVGELRWKPPQPVVPWQGIRECTDFGNASPQVASAFSPGPYSEDCLYLNVLTPAKRTDERLPVLVWFHGGGFSVGSGHNSRAYNSPSLSQHGAVLVTVNHRLGAIGLLAHPALSKESPQGVSGNYLFLDLIAALQWVQKNIQAFGGDPDKVCIFGESGGGAKVAILVASPLAKGLFQRAICESGVASFPTPLSLKEAEALGEKLAAKVGVTGTGSEALAALRRVSWEDLVKANMELATELSAARRATTGAVDLLTIDGWLMPDHPNDIFAEGRQNPVPVIACANLGELIAEKSFLVMPQLVDEYVKMLSGVRKAGAGAYACIFSQVPGNWRQDGVLAYHGLEVPYVFGDLESINTRLHYMIFAQPSGAKQQDPGLGGDDYSLSELMMNMWVQFARTGDPNIKDAVNWPIWEPTTDQYLELKWPAEVRSGFSRIAKR